MTYDLVDDASHGIHGDAESDPGACAGWGVDRHVDPNKAPAGVEQRTAGILRIENKHGRAT